MRHGLRRRVTYGLAVSHASISALSGGIYGAPAKTPEIAGAFNAHKNIPAKTLVFTGIVT